MTFEQFAHDHLFNNGMFQQDVEKVIELAKQDDLLKDTMNNRWGDNLDDYPMPLQNVFLVSLNRIAVKYIDANIPQAWFRRLFTGEPV